MGLPVIANLQAPGPVDCVISCLGASRVTELMKDCASKGGERRGALHGRLLRNRQDPRPRSWRVRSSAWPGPGHAESSAPTAWGPTVLRPAWLSVPISPGRAGMSASSARAAPTRSSPSVPLPGGVRFSKVVSYGNACDVDECDLLEYFAGRSCRPASSLPISRCEGWSPAGQCDQARSASMKPVIILKSRHQPGWSQGDCLTYRLAGRVLRRLGDDAVAERGHSGAQPG